MTDYFREWGARSWHYAEGQGFSATLGEQIALIHSEVSEALEAIRNHNPPCEKLPGFTALEEEFADIILRVCQLAYSTNSRIAEAVEAKHSYNLTRPYKHGGKAL